MSSGTNHDPCSCPKWLCDILVKHSEQIKETERFGPTAVGIVTRLLKGSDDIDAMIELHFSSCDCKGDEYFRGLYNGLHMAQVQLQDCEYNPL